MCNYLTFQKCERLMNNIYLINLSFVFNNNLHLIINLKIVLTMQFRIGAIVYVPYLVK